jgi:hypothetical protein
MRGRGDELGEVQLQEGGVDAQKTTSLRCRRNGRVVVVLQRLEIMGPDPGGIGDFPYSKVAKLAGLPKPVPY